ncbi:MAG: sugar phosphate isomerase/epimerase [Ruminococcaceae bacterium]|nr:sugar phosphate isomerase/epimerase [Oscillospiraceae bacterium]
MNRPIIGLSSCGKRLDEELFKSYISSGITHMEISEGKAACEAMDFDRIAELAKNSEVILWSFHLPFAPFSEIDISNPDLAGATVDYYLGLIKKATAIGIEKFIVHPSGEPISPEDRPLRLACAKEHLALLAQKAAELGAVICVEDLPRTCLGNCSAEMLELLSAHSALRSCFDTNHMLSEDLVGYANAVGDKIVTLHVSDYDFVNERHWLPGEGDVDWKELYAAIKATGYSGPWLYELGFECPATILRDRALTCADFARNANEIFEGKDLTVIARRKPNLGMWE